MSGKDFSLTLNALNSSIAISFSLGQEKNFPWASLMIIDLANVPVFCTNLITMLQERIDVSPYELDHVCYRVETEEEYRKSYQYLTERGILLVEQPIGGRLIATFKLHKPIAIPEFSKSVSVIELPLPKIGS
jgi:predicted metalloenzyme YecM